MESLNYLLAQVFGVSFHVPMISHRSTVLFFAVLYLLDMEIHTHQAPLQLYKEGVEDLTENGKMLVVHFPSETLSCEIWKEVRIHLAQLMQNKDEFQNIAIYYHNVDIIVRLAQLETVPREKRQPLYSVGADSLLEASYSARETIKRYIQESYKTYDVVVDIKADAQQIDQ